LRNRALIGAMTDLFQRINAVNEMDPGTGSRCRTEDSTSRPGVAVELGNQSLPEHAQIMADHTAPKHYQVLWRTVRVLVGEANRDMTGGPAMAHRLPRTYKQRGRGLLAESAAVSAGCQASRMTAALPVTITRLVFALRRRYPPGMAIHVFRSLRDDGVLGFTESETGEVLPADRGPWERLSDGTAMPIALGARSSAARVMLAEIAKVGYLIMDSEALGSRPRAH
jgi:hypothetical protein